MARRWIKAEALTLDDRVLIYKRRYERVLRIETYTYPTHERINFWTKTITRSCSPGSRVYICGAK